ncbi:MAG: CHAT domain-containing protein [Nannocystaceae bacterium]
MAHRSPGRWLVLAMGLLVGVLAWRWWPRAELATAGPSAHDPVPESTPPLEVSIAGCSDSAATPPRCRLDGNGGPLTLWVAGRERPHLRLDGSVLTPIEAVPTEDPGWRLVLPPPIDATTLTVHDHRGAEHWRLALAPAIRTPRVDAVRQALPDATAPDREQAYREAVSTLEAMTDLPLDESLQAQRLLGQLLHQLGRRDEGARHTEAALALAMQHGRDATAVELGLLLVPLRQSLGEEQGARWALDTVRALLPTVLDAEAEGLWSYYEGLHSGTEQDRGTALRRHARAETIARRLGLTDLELSAAAQRVVTLGLLGRTQEQDALVERMLALMEPLPRLSCKHALYLNDAGWSLLLGAQEGRPRPAALRLLQRAERIFEPGGGCEVGEHPDWQHTLISLRLNLALEALLRGEPDTARAQLEAASALTVPAVLRPWVGYTRARLALARDEPELALSLVDAVESDPSLDADPLLPWQVAVLRGDLHRLLGAPEPALSAYLLAERRLDELMRTVGIDQGREGLLAGVHTSAARAIELLLRRGETSQAAAVARTSRARALRPMGRAAQLSQLPAAARVTWQQERSAYRTLARRLEHELASAWRLPDDERQRLHREHARVRETMRAHLDAAYRALETAQAPVATSLASPEPGQLWLLTHPLPEGWVVFGLTADQVLVHRLAELPPLADPEAMADALLAPFGSALDDADSLQVLAMGPLVEVPVHALPWRGEPLLAALPVVYKLDLGAPSTAAVDGGRALIVADPAVRREGLGRLPLAREEGRQVARTLTAKGWRVTTLQGEDATPTALAEALASADLLHYAGHGEHAGTEGWDSALPLAAETSLDVRDVLALPHSPRTVVLSGCETGLSDGSLRSGGMHLAGAFLVAGSSYVVAATREVPDALASAVGTALYDTDSPQPTGLREALLPLRGRTEPWARQWSAYRGFIP